MTTPFYRAFCKKCDCTVKTDDRSTWMSPFFLPERCPGCHAFHSRHANWHSSESCLYRVEYGFWDYVLRDDQPQRLWWNPLTWAPRVDRVWTEWDEREARQ